LGWTGSTGGGDERLVFPGKLYKINPLSCDYGGQMKKTLFTILFMLGLALILAAASTLVFKDWLAIPGGWLAVIGIAFLAIATIGGGLKDWRDIIFHSEKSMRSPVSQRSQEMTGSEEGEQIMRGRGGVQKQEMTESPRGKQKME
jgi:hypothetical protein